MDTIVQALSGLMMTSGEADANRRCAWACLFGDPSAPLFAVIGTWPALMQGRRTRAEASMWTMSLLGAITRGGGRALRGDAATGQPTRTGNTMPRLAPFGIFATQDGHIAICAPTDGFTASLFDAMGRP